MDISILKVESPNCLWARIVPSVTSNSSDECVEFLELSRQINAYCESIQEQSEDLIIGQYYIVQNPKSNRWCRAQLRTVLQSSHGYFARCYLLDFAGFISVHESRIRNISDKFLQLPWQAKKFILHELQSFSTSLDDLKAEFYSNQKWSISAFEYVENLVKENNCGRAEVLYTDNSGSLHSKIYLKRNSIFFCLNDDLIAKTFGTLKQVNSNCDYQKTKYLDSKLENINFSLESELQTLYKEEHCDNVSAAARESCLPFCLQSVHDSEKCKIEEVDIMTSNPSKQIIPNNETVSVNSPKMGTINKILDHLNHVESHQLMCKSHFTQNEKIDFKTNIDFNSVSFKKNNIVNNTLMAVKMPTLSNNKNDFLSASNNLDLIHSLDNSEKQIGCKINPQIKMTKPTTFEVYCNPLPSHLLDFQGTENKNVNQISLLKSVYNSTSSYFHFSFDKRDFLFYGNCLPHGITQLSHSPFSVFLRKLDYVKEPSLVQCYGWPSVLRGRNTIIVAPPQTGKTLSYLMPLISNLSHVNKYKSLPIGSGPIAIILSSSWITAQEICNTCESLCACISNCSLQSFALYGGCGDWREFNLINGCSILIATPKSLFRLLKGGSKIVMNFDRLCHIVLDDANLLLEDFSQEIKGIILEFAKSVKKKHPDIPKQLICCSSKWTCGIESLFHALPNPILLMASKVEIAVASRMKIIPHICSDAEKITIFIGILETSSDSQKIVIHCKDKNSVSEVVLLLKNESYYTLSAHDGMLKFHLDDIKDQWISSTSKSILVLQDSCIKDLKLTNAECSIHYDFTDNKYIFGERAGCQMDNLKKNISKQQNNSKHPVCHIIFSDQNKHFSSIFVKLLTRYRINIPEQLLKAARKELFELEKKKINESLCPKLKTYGKCNSLKCVKRHIIHPEKDKPLLAQNGDVKVFITQVVTASRYYGRLCKHRSFNGSVVDFSNSFFQLSADINHYFSKESNCHLLKTFHKNEVCAVCDKDFAFYRGQIVENQKNCKDDEISVFLIDKGECNNYKMSELLILPDHFKSIPFQAVEIYLCNIKPVDNDCEWTVQASEFIHNLIYNKELDGKIVLSLSNTLWLDPLAERSYLQNVSTTVYKFNIRNELINYKYASENEDHMKLLFSAVDGKIEIPPMKENVINTLEKEKKPFNDYFSFLFIDGFQEIWVENITSPSWFYVQRKDTISALDELMDVINCLESKCEDKIVLPSVGCFCLAKFPEDGNWYRAVIEETSLNDNETLYLVFFVDHGDKSTVTRDCLRLVEPEHFTLPFQAIKCSLYGIDPINIEWDDKTVDIFWNLTHNENNEHKYLFARVKKKKSNLSHEQACYLIELFDTSKNVTLDIAWALVCSNVASPTADYFNSLINFSGISEEDKKLIDGLKELWIKFYWASEEKLNVVKILYDKLQSAEMKEKFYNESHLKFISYSGLVKVLCRFLLLDNSIDVMNHLTLCLVYLLFHCEYIYELAYKENALEILANVSKTTNSVDIQIKIVHAFNNMADPELVTEFNWKPEILNFLYHMLFTIDNESVQLEICSLLQIDLAENYKNCEDLKTCETINKFGILIANASNSVLIEILKVFQIFAKDDSNKKAMSQERILKTLFNILESKDVKAHFIILEIFDKLIIDSSKIEKILKGLGFLNYLSQDILISNKTDSEKLKYIRFRLLDQLADLPPESFSNTYSLTNSFLSKTEYLPSLTNMERKNLSITWFQTGAYIKLSLKVANIIDDLFEWHVTSTKLEVYAVSNSQLFCLKLELFDKIFPKYSTYTLLGPEIQITLEKVFPKLKWKRLVKQKKSPPYITFNYDNNVSDDETEIVCQSNCFASPCCSSADNDSDSSSTSDSTSSEQSDYENINEEKMECT